MAEQDQTTQIEPFFEPFEKSKLKALLAKRLPLVIAGVVVVMVLIISSAILFLSSPSSSTSHSFVLSNSAPVVPSAKPKSSSTTTSGSGTQVFSSRDPFVSPIPVPTTTPPTTIPVTTTTIPATTTTTTPTTPPTSTSPSGTTGTTSVGGTTPPTSTSATGTFYPQPDQQISLLNISNGAQGPIADVQVGGVSYMVSPNQKFANSYQVISLSATTQCGQFSYQSSPFQLCKSQQILK